MGLFSCFWNGKWKTVETEALKLSESVIREKEAEIKRIAALCKELRDDRDKAMKNRDEMTDDVRSLKDALGKRVAEIEGWKITVKDMADKIVEKDKKIGGLEVTITSMTNKYSKEISDKVAEIAHLKKLIDDHLVLWKAVIDASEPMLAVIKAKDNIIPF